MVRRDRFRNTLIRGNPRQSSDDDFPIPPPQQRVIQPFDRDDRNVLMKRLISKMRRIEQWEKDKFINNELWNEYRNGPRDCISEYNVLRSYYDAMCQRYEIYCEIANLLYIDRNQTFARDLTQDEVDEYSEAMDQLEQMDNEVLQQSTTLTNPPPFERFVFQYKEFNEDLDIDDEIRRANQIVKKIQKSCLPM